MPIIFNSTLYLHSLYSQYSQPTSSPSHSPTENPTSSPSHSPTKEVRTFEHILRHFENTGYRYKFSLNSFNLSHSHFSQPTSSPSHSPTLSPTDYPTASPSHSPTKEVSTYEHISCTILRMPKGRYRYSFSCNSFSDHSRSSLYLITTLSSSSPNI